MYVSGITGDLRHDTHRLSAMMLSTSRLSNCAVASLVPVALRQSDLLVSDRCSSEKLDEETDQLR